MLVLIHPNLMKIYKEVVLNTTFKSNTVISFNNPFNYLEQLNYIFPDLLLASIFFVKFINININNDIDINININIFNINILIIIYQYQLILN